MGARVVDPQDRIIKPVRVSTRTFKLIEMMAQADRRKLGETVAIIVEQEAVRRYGETVITDLEEAEAI